MEQRIVHRLPIKHGLNPSRVRVDHEWAGRTAGELLAHLIATQRYRAPEDDEAALAARFATGEVIDGRGRQLQPDSVLEEHQDVWFHRMPAPEEPVPFDIDILHQDADLIVIDKPHFLATFPRASHITETALVRLRRALGNDELSPAHRLDRMTAGVLLFTARREIRGAYQELFARREARKTYEAIAAFDPAITPGTVWQHRMEKTHGDVKARIVDGDINAITEVAAVTPLSLEQQALMEAAHGPQPQLAVYELHPRTGRTHQLRLHMWAAGVPILGDPVYPEFLRDAHNDYSRPLRLLARTLEFSDPLNGQLRRFSTRRAVYAGAR
ncbi:23S rRNA pseudouridylate synthase [Corynebacterium sp. 13CS0277]|uniref:pseudouridine synthase n=1 Tax=Corynebacterium sp. 13CS0277 TaxID=2071994 RepID=UPI000D0342D0|nr:pseudouridine synthase [Corynebacterium sp. 13CS0277]PRQ10460.1 23S rRNA pseudouridylate synthase [Corynebacterium sp. 13CS0277]